MISSSSSNSTTCQILSSSSSLIGVDTDTCRFARQGTPDARSSLLVYCCMARFFSIVRVPCCLNTRWIQWIVGSVIVVTCDIGIMFRLADCRITGEIGSGSFGLILIQTKSKDASSIAPNTRISILIGGRIAFLLCFIVVVSIHSGGEAHNVIWGHDWVLLRSSTSCSCCSCCSCCCSCCSSGSRSCSRPTATGSCFCLDLW